MSADENTYEVVLRAKTTVPGNTVWCVAAPHDGKGFFPSRLVIPDEVALNFFVIDVRVNRVSQLGSVGALPAELFGASGPGFDLMFDQVGEDAIMTIYVQSTRDEATEFTAHVLGRWTLRSGVRKTCLGMGCTEVAAESSVNVCVTPQRIFRPTHLFLPSDVAPRLEGFSNEGFAESLYEVLSAKLHELTGARLPPVVGQTISGQGGLKS